MLKKELLLLIMLEDGGEQVWHDEEDEYTKECFPELSEMAELYLYSLVGISSPHTMKLR